MIHQYILFLLFALISQVLVDDLQLAFTSTPLAVVAGQAYNLTWSGGDGVSPVTIELRRGDSANLIWVADLTTDATGGSYLWTVANDLPDVTDYALQLFEMSNITNVNYSARFSLSGGASSPTASTTSQAAGTGVGTGSSMGTGSALPRNTTFMTPTLTAAITCSGLDGICAGSAATTAMVEPTYVNPSTTLPSIAITTAKIGAAQGSSVERKLALMAVVVLALL